MFKLPELGYEYNALEPHIDVLTMEIHHTKHHGGYVEKLNAALEKYPDLQSKKIEELLSGIKDVPEAIRQAVINHGGGHHNHSLLWQIIKPGGSQNVPESIIKTFGGLDKFQKQITEVALSRFGSGWAWLTKDGNNLEIYSTANQDSPLMEGKIPILGIDMWEHSFYLKHKWDKIGYLEDFFKVINWDVVAERLNT